MDNNNMFNQEPQVLDSQQSYQSQEPYQQPFQSQGPYQQEVPNVNNDLEVPESFGDWMLTILLTKIPCVNIIFLLIWAFGNGEKKTKSNYSKAFLLWKVIEIVISLILLAAYSVFFVRLISNYS